MCNQVRESYIKLEAYELKEPLQKISSLQNKILITS